MWNPFNAVAAEYGSVGSFVSESSVYPGMGAFNVK